jgi:hypothetical protein
VLDVVERDDDRPTLQVGDLTFPVGPGPQRCGRHGDVIEGDRCPTCDDDLDGYPMECLNSGDPTGCSGPVEMHQRRDGASFPRCAKHQERREDQRLNSMEAYADSDCIPEWFDPGYAGESWDGE